MHTMMSMKLKMMGNPMLYTHMALENDRTLNDWLPLYLESIKSDITINTYNNYNSYIHKHILPEIGTYKLMEITTPLIKRFIMNKLQNGRIRFRDKQPGLSTKTVKEHFILLKKALNKAVEEGEMLFNPCQSVSFPKQVKSEVQALEQEEQMKLESEIHDKFICNSTMTAKLALYGGLRNGEICALKIGDVDFNKGLINVSKTLYRTQTKEGKTSIMVSSTKNKRQRYIPIPDELKHSLKVYIDTMPKDMRNDPNHFLFINKRGNPLEPRRLLFHFKKLLMQAGLPDIRFHNLRHTFATRCLECGIDMKIVSKILGHSTIQITADLYTHVTNRTMQRAMTKFNKENWMIAYQNT